MIQVLRPFKIQPSRCRSARVCIEKISEPASGSLAALAPSRLPSQSPGRYRRFLRLGAEGQDRHRGRPERRAGGEDQARVGAAVSQALHGRGRGQQVLAAAAVFRRHGQALDAEAGAAPVALTPELSPSFALDRIGVG